MQVYTYRPDAMKMLMAVAFFGFGAAFMAFDALTDHRAMLIDGFVRLAPGTATLVRWATAGLCGLGAGFGLMALGLVLFGEQRIVVGDEALEIPKSPFSAEVATVPYRTIHTVQLITVRNHRFLKLTAKRSFTIAEGKLPDPEAFEAIQRAIAAGRAVVVTAPFPAGPQPTSARAALSAPPAGRPSAPKSFGRRA